MFEKYRVKRFIFPGVLTFLFVLAVALGINGSSVGMYHNFLAGGHDKDLVFGVPQPVRSDEWLVITPMTVSQYVNHYPVINKDIGGGQDMTVILDAPVKDWSTLLRPWNWGFFFLPLKNAFAFKWWAMSLALGIAAYLFILKLFPGKYLLGSLGALFLILSPFVQWWYREYTAGLLAFGLASLVTIICIHQSGTKRRKLLLVPPLAYFMAGFIFIQYPPFEVLLALGIGLFYLAYVLNLLSAVKAKARRLAIFKDVGLVATAAVIALAVIGVFLVQHASALKALEHTTYPGKRAYPSGEGNLLTLVHLFSSNTMPFLQKHTAVVQSFFGNQSEASLFIQYSLILLVPMGAVIFKNRQAGKKLNWLLVTLPIGMLLVYAFWFIPGLTPLFKPLLFTKVPVDRFDMLLGILDFFSLLVLAKEFPSAFKDKKALYRLAALSGFIALMVFLFADFYLRAHFPGLVSAKLMILSAIWMAGALVSILINKKELGFAMLVILSLASVWRINPLYDGLGALTDTPLARYIRNTSRQNPDARWITTDQMLEGYLPANGARSITGDYSYPQLSLWKTIDKNPADLPSYNRAVHAEAVISPSNYVELHTTNTIFIHLDPCSSLMRTLDIKYLATTATQSNKCLDLKASFPVAAGTVNIYAVKPSAQ